MQWRIERAKTLAGHGNQTAFYYYQMKTKNKLVDFIVEQWISNSSLIGDKIVIVTNNNEAYKITRSNCILIPELEINHKESLKLQVVF